MMGKVEVSIFLLYTILIIIVSMMLGYDFHPEAINTETTVTINKTCYTDYVDGIERTSIKINGDYLEFRDEIK